MVGLSSLFEIARSALTTTQLQLTVAGHNVANVNTPGYSRQQAILTERPPLNGQPGMIGTGVQATQVQRVVDQFVNRQLTDVQQNLGNLNVTSNQLAQLQQMFDSTSGQDINAQLNNVFAGMQDVASNPADTTARSVLVQRALLLTGSLNQASSDLAAQRVDLNQQIQQTVVEINTYAGQIADLNDKIVSAEVTGQNANDLRDQRDLVINKLAQDVDISTIESQDGSLSVFVARGQVLVQGSTTRQLATVANLDNDGLSDVGYNTGGTRALSISSLITNGRLKGLLDLRDATIPATQQSFDRLTATLVNEVNQVHQQGYGLDGSTGRNFFTPLSVTARASAVNQGSAGVTASAITANSLLTFHDYQIRFTSPTTYSIVDQTTGSGIRGNYTGTAISAPTANGPLSIITGTNDTLTVTVDGTTSGTIALAGGASPGLAYSSGASLAAEIQSKINGDATLQAAGRSVTVSFDSTTSRFVITSNSSGSNSAVAVTGGSARAALGLVSGTGTAASGTYSGPQTLNFDGLSVTVSGTPSADDVLTVNSYAKTAGAVTVAITSGAQFAASSTPAGIPGDNTSALAMTALQQQQFASLDGTTFNGAYSNIASTVGIAAQTATQQLDAQNVLQDQVNTLRSQTSGVSIDEELVNLIQYQRGFEAASRLISITDQMLQTLLGLGQHQGG
ncbi:MAG TPA: flagellar hook-associated protein FlgK [Nitrospira sp.]|nr:flagellar hook-associated protein FlgK [Nitrospira sp.]